MKRNLRKKDRRQERPRLLLPVSELLLQSLHEAVVRSGLEGVAGLVEAERTEACGPPVPAPA